MSVWVVPSGLSVSGSSSSGTGSGSGGGGGVGTTGGPNRAAGGGGVGVAAGSVPPAEPGSGVVCCKCYWLGFYLPGVIVGFFIGVGSFGAQGGAEVVGGPVFHLFD